MKSWMAALIGILFLYSEQEGNGEILITATAQRQSRRIFDLIVWTLRSNPELMSYIRVQDVGSTLTNINTGTRLIATPADPAKLWGMSPSVVLSDEAHAWTGSKGHKLWNSLITGQGARPNPLWAILTTGPDAPPNADDLFAEQLKYAWAVESGDIDDRRYLPMIWVCPEDADTTDEKVWAQYNPGLGFSLTPEELQEEYERATQSDADMAGFKAMRLNQIPTSSLDAGWLSPASIERCIQPLDLDEMRDASIRAIGLDMGGSWDLASISIVADDGSRVMVKQISWLCRTAFERFKTKVPLQEFVDRGELIVDGSEAVSSEMIASELISLCAELELDQVAVDPAMLGLIAPTLESAGIELRAARQGMMSMSPAIHLAEELISAGNLLIGDDHLMCWALGNTAMASASIGRRPVKIGDDQSVNPRKIDPVSAMLTALQLVMEQRFGEGSAYVSDAHQPELVCPWTDPISARAVNEGGVPVVPMSDDPIDPNTGAWTTT